MFHKTILSISLLLAAPLLLALPSDFDAPIGIEAEYVEIDPQDGRSIYRGNVKLIRGSLEITADQVRIQQLDESGHVQATIIGSPAQYTQKPSENAVPLNASAQEIIYRSSDDIIEMRGDARLTRDADRVTSELIRYDMRRDLIIAGKHKSDTGNGERVRITIQPSTFDDQ